MKLYHASNCIVDNPDVLHSRDFLDFGKGFYLTALKEQARKYALPVAIIISQACLWMSENRNFN